MQQILTNQLILPNMEIFENDNLPSDESGLVWRDFDFNYFEDEDLDTIDLPNPYNTSIPYYYEEDDEDLPTGEEEEVEEVEDKVKTNEYLKFTEFEFIKYLMSIYNWDMLKDINVSDDKLRYNSRCKRFLLLIENRVTIKNREIVNTDDIKITIARLTDNKIINNHITQSKELRKILIRINFNPNQLLFDEE